MKKSVSLLFATGIACCVTPALAGPPYNVDDPGTAQKGEIRFVTSFQSSESQGKESYTFPDFLLTYGITDSLQIKFDSGVITKRIKKRVESGVEDTVLGLKWRFFNETKKLPQWAIAIQSKLPTADASRGLGTGDTDYKLTVSVGKSFGRFKLAANAGENFLGDAKSRDNGFYGILGMYQVTEQLNVGVQWYGNASSAAKKREEQAWGVGMRYRYAPDHILLLSLGRSERGYSNLNAYAGLQVNFK